MVRESVEGQAMELGWMRDNVVDLSRRRLPADDPQEDVLVHVHPPLPHRRADRHRPARRRSTASTAFGFCLGAAFQIQDDMLNLIGDQAQYGKEIRGDIWRASAR